MYKSNSLFSYRNADLWMEKRFRHQSLARVQFHPYLREVRGQQLNRLRIHYVRCGLAGSSNRSRRNALAAGQAALPQIQKVAFVGSEGTKRIKDGRAIVGKRCSFVL